MREIKIIVDNHTGCEFSLDGEWFMGKGRFATTVDRFYSSAVLHFLVEDDEALGGAVRFWERLSAGNDERRMLKKNPMMSAALGRTTSTAPSTSSQNKKNTHVEMDPVEVVDHRNNFQSTASNASALRSKMEQEKKSSTVSLLSGGSYTRGGSSSSTSNGRNSGSASGGGMNAMTASAMNSKNLLLRGGRNSSTAHNYSSDIGRQLCIAFGNPHPEKAYDILNQQNSSSSSSTSSAGNNRKSTQLQLSLRNEWARAAQQAGGAPFTLLVGPCDGNDGLGVGEGMVGQQTCSWEVVAENDDSTVVRLSIESSTDVKVTQGSIHSSGTTSNSAAQTRQQAGKMNKSSGGFSPPRDGASRSSYGFNPQTNFAPPQRGTTGSQNRSGWQQATDYSGRSTTGNDRSTSGSRRSTATDRNSAGGDNLQLIEADGEQQSIDVANLRPGEQKVGSGHQSKNRNNQVDQQRLQQQYSFGIPHSSSNKPQIASQSSYSSSSHQQPSSSGNYTSSNLSSSATNGHNGSFENGDGGGLDPSNLEDLQHRKSESQEHVLTQEQIDEIDAIYRQMEERKENAEQMEEIIKDEEVDMNRLRTLEENAKSDIVLTFALCAAQQLCTDLDQLIVLKKSASGDDLVAHAGVNVAGAPANSGRGAPQVDHRPQNSIRDGNTQAIRAQPPKAERIQRIKQQQAPSGRPGTSGGGLIPGGGEITTTASAVKNATPPVTPVVQKDLLSSKEQLQIMNVVKNPIAMEQADRKVAEDLLTSEVESTAATTPTPASEVDFTAAGAPSKPKTTVKAAAPGKDVDERDDAARGEREQVSAGAGENSVGDEDKRRTGRKDEDDTSSDEEDEGLDPRPWLGPSNDNTSASSSPAGSPPLAPATSANGIDKNPVLSEETETTSSRAGRAMKATENKDHSSSSFKSIPSSSSVAAANSSRAQDDQSRLKDVRKQDLSTSQESPQGPTANANKNVADYLPINNDVAGGMKSASATCKPGPPAASPRQPTSSTSSASTTTNAMQPMAKTRPKARLSKQQSSKLELQSSNAHWLQAENVKSLAKFRKILIRKHLLILQALAQEILQLEQTAYEPLVEVYRNCVHVEKGMNPKNNIEYNKIISQRFPSGKQRLLLTRDLVAALLLSGLLDARCRVLMFVVAEKGFDVSKINIMAWEREIGGALFKILASENRVDNSSKYWKVAGGVIGGGLLLGLTGGLAAPAVSVGLGAIGSAVAGAGAAVGLGAAGTAVAGTLGAVGVALSSLGTAGAVAVFGTIGAGMTGVKLGKRFGDLSEFVFVPMSDEKKITSISGFGNFHYIQRLQLYFADGRLLEYGEEDDGTVFEPFCLTADEYLVQVEGYFSEPENRKNLGYCLEFTTNLGRVGKFASTGSYLQLESTIFKSKKAPMNEQIVGLKFRRNRLQSLECSPVSSTTSGESGAVQLVLFISGWLKEEQQVTETWRKVATRHFPNSDYFSLRWETAQLLKLGNVLSDTVKSYVGETAANLWVRATVATVSVSAAYAIVWPWYVVSYLKDLDHEWAVIKERAKLAGQALANAIADRQALGQRPVVLVGHSMGARVIFYCLQELHALGAYHCVMHAVLLGTPCSPKGEGWERARQVVSGRLINGYITSDWILGFLYRYMEWKIAVAGLGPVTEINGVENHDLSDLVASHDEYPKRINEIFTRLRFY
ncbi:unnamed protein product [Amoebophrya sp. A120]|nr:unnamed protein product [Amoebophrya sp. A120]|eukprot:GSA120T00012600001.1